MKILFVSSEVYPYAKTGGLADVAGSLPLALKNLGHDVRIIMPAHKIIYAYGSEIKQTGRKVNIPVGDANKTGRLYEGKLDNQVPIYFVGNDEYFNRVKLYGEHGRDYADNAARFTFFNRAVLEACKALSFQPDIIHCNDWQTGLIPAYLKSLYRSAPFFSRTRTLFTIHNMGYQGNFNQHFLPQAHLPWSLYTPDGVEFYGKFSFLKSGLIFSDILTTVSQSYSKEIRTSEYGFSMDGVLRHRSKDLYGILNGADYSYWDPSTNPWIKKNYSPKNLQGKQECREDLVSRMKLKVKPETPVLCFISRLCHQKGVRLVMQGIQDIMKMGAAFVALGEGDSEYQEFFRQLPKRFPGRCASHIGYDESLAHKTFAGGDMLLIPSQYEPCGLTQLYGLKYGTVPIVRAVGGLQDTVQRFSSSSKKGTGFKFKGFKFNSFNHSIQRAINIYKKDETIWRQLVLNGMSRDYSWRRSARKYVGLYHKALRSTKPKPSPIRQLPARNLNQEFDLIEPDSLALAP